MFVFKENKRSVISVSRLAWVAGPAVCTAETVFVPACNVVDFTTELVYLSVGGS